MSGTFPDGFLWGAATAGHQVEGGNINANMWPMEWAEGSVFAEPSGDACDHYHRYQEDIATLAALGLNAYRFSVEWSRIEPERGFFSRAALDHYRRMAASCHEHAVTPVVTYSHFTTPRWFAAMGGWKEKSSPDLFGRFAERVTAHLGDLVPWACTLNEPNLSDLLGQLGVTGAPETGLDEEKVAPIIGPGVEVMAKAHRRAVEAIKAGPGNTRAGWTLALVDFQAADGGEEQCQKARQVVELDWLEVSREDDFVGVQTYTRARIGPNGAVPAEANDRPRTENGWEFYPEALEHTIGLAAAATGGPVMVTENGVATSDDGIRRAYTEEALAGVARCLSDGIDVRGYLHWSLLDNFEWMFGYGMHFGLIAVDRETFGRTIKPTARWLGEVARANRLP
ncbi:MAG TPA: family 1 glycosylhydrolase [Acidimicrobiales bacterium]|nr:family 1 glycosylhydrolase [Acidimicrobiales bacterium]